MPRLLRHAANMKWSAVFLGLALFLSVGFDATGAAEDSRVHRIGFKILTQADDRSIAADTIEIRYDGPIAYPMAENLAEIWMGLAGRYRIVVLDLNSHGGDLHHAKAVASILRDIRESVRLQTIVRLDHSCLSACVLVYMQGEDRIAGNATSWLFHGPRRLETNVPSPGATQEYISLLRDAGVHASFLAMLVEGGRLNNPGAYWMSGHELFETYRANIVTRLLDPWQPEEPVEPPVDTRIRTR